MSTLFQHGAFNAYDVMMARESLLAYSLGLPGFMLVKILASAFYAKQDMKLPVRAAVISMSVNMVLNLALIIPLAHAGLALATSCASLLNAGLLLWWLLKKKGFSFEAGWRKFLIRLTVASGVMAAVLITIVDPIDEWMAWDSSERAMHLVAFIAIGMVVYLVCLWAVGVRWREWVSAS